MKKLVIIVDSISDDISDVVLKNAMADFRETIKSPETKIRILRVDGEVNVNV
jgi:hypothetical protein